MVLSSPKYIETSTSALLTCNPENLELGLQVPAKTVSLADSQVVNIIDKLQDNASTSAIRHTQDSKFNPTDRYLEKYNNNISDFASLLVKRSEITNLINYESWGIGNRCTNVMPSRCRRISPPKMVQSTSGCTGNHMRTYVDMSHHMVSNTYAQSFKKILSSSSLSNSASSSSSSDSESSCDECTLTNPQFNKKIEQALKLGYKEKPVSKVLKKLGPDCSYNDLILELIKLGARKSSLRTGQSELPEADVVFLENVFQQGIPGQDSTLMPVGSSALHIFVDPERSGQVTAGLSNSLDVTDSGSDLRHIIIDGSNVAMSHGKNVFSCRGIQIAVDWFQGHGHKNITAFVPQWRKETSRPDAPITDQEILCELERKGIVVFTPARRVNGRRVVCYDDRYILKLAVETDGIIVSNDIYRDLVSEREDFRRVVEQRLLMYSFVNDRFMPPEDPLGRQGPSLDNFLRKAPANPGPRAPDCPYGRKCTYGNKCRYYHPERGFAPQKSITDSLKEQTDLKLQERATKLSEMAEKVRQPKPKLARTKSLLHDEPLTSPDFSSSAAKTKNKHMSKFGHSKSLVLSTKSPDYLNEHRKKLEEAEQSADIENVVAQAVGEHKSLEEIHQSGKSEKRSKSKFANQKPSLDLQIDPIKQNMNLTEYHPQQTSPLKTLMIRSPRTSPSLLMIPKPDSPEGYLSGHLYLAKKLSDESVENNFFSGYTSSPSSTRTSSPVISCGKSLEQKHGVADNKSKDEQGENSKQSNLSPQSCFSLLPQQMHDDLNPSAGERCCSADGVAKENLMEERTPQLLQKFDSGLPSFIQQSDNLNYNRLSSAEKSDSLNYTLFGNVMNFSCSEPDSGHSTMSEQSSSLYQTNPKYALQLLGLPLYRRAEATLPEHHPSSVYTHSSTDVSPGDNSHLKLTRSSSSNPALGEHLLQQPDVFVQHSLLPPGLTRQNSSSDPQISNIARDSQNVALAAPGFNFPRKSSQDSCTFLNQQNQKECQKEPQLFHHQYSFQHQLQGNYDEPLKRMPHHQHHLRPPMHQQRYPHQQYPTYQQQSDSLHAAPQLVPKSSIESKGEYFSWPNLSFRSSPVGILQFNQAQGTAQHHMRLPSPTANPRYLITGAIPRFQQWSYYDRSHPLQSAVYNNSSSGHNITSGHSFNSYPPTHAQTLMSLNRPVVINEDAVISPDDPRYPIYYHLSSIFGEAVVRKVMNSNPHVLSPDGVCKLVIKCRESKEM